MISKAVIRKGADGRWYFSVASMTPPMAYRLSLTGYREWAHCLHDALIWQKALS